MIPLFSERLFLFMKFLKFLIIFILLLVPLTVTAQGQITLVADGKKVESDVSPVIVNNRTLVPVRVISELNGARVEWDSAERKVKIKSDKVEIELKIDSEKATLNGKTVVLDAAAAIVSNRTMVPVRFVAEAFGYEVGWAEATRTVTLKSPPKAEATGKARLNTIGSANTDKGYRITIKFNSPMTGECKMFELDNPARVVVDIENAEIDYTTQFDFANDVVKCARAGNHDNFLRVTVDLKEKAAYTTYINEARDAVVLFFDVKSTEPEIKDDPASEENKGEGEKPGSNGKFTVVVDPGHGGSDPGAIGKENGIAVAYEDDVNLAVALVVRDILEQAGINVVMTRETSVRISLGERCEISNNANADLFVSIHSNAMEEGYEHINGTMVFYGAAKDKENPWVSSKALAGNILTDLTEAIETKNQGVQNGDQLAVIRGTVAPAVLVELAFITNPEDRAKLVSPEYQQKAAQGIVSGILKTLE